MWGAAPMRSDPMSTRKRLPNRRPSYTETLEVDGQALTATVGFDPKSGQPCELFMSAGKEGSMLDTLLADAAVAISVALQHGVPAAALAKSVGWLPAVPIGLANLDCIEPGRMPASPIGAALDLVSSFERKSAK